VKRITRYKPGKDANTFEIVGAIVSEKGNYNIKPAYKKRFDRASYVKCQLNGLAALKSSHQKKERAPIFKSCNSAFLENYLLSQREKKIQKMQEKAGWGEMGPRPDSKVVSLRNLHQGNAFSSNNKFRKQIR
jgi:hypothetical protein